MSDINRLNTALQEHSDELMRLSSEYQDLAVVAVHKRNAYDLSKARNQLKIRTDDAFAKSTVAEKEAQVRLLTETEMVNARIAESMLDACKTRLRAVEASLSAVQTQARMLKVESNLDNYRT